MSVPNGFSLKMRLLIFCSLWILAAVIVAVFAEGAAEAGDSAFYERFGVFYLMPLLAATGLSFALGFQNHMPAASCAIGMLFIAHAAITLTRTTRRSFLVMSMLQVVILLISIASVLYFFHYEATHGHG